MVRNHGGLVVLARARPVKMGLTPGSADLIGWRSITITPDMVGKKLAVFTSVEMKAKGGRTADNQANWAQAIAKAGGIAIIGYSPEAISQSLLKWKP